MAIRIFLNKEERISIKEILEGFLGKIEEEFSFPKEGASISDPIPFNIPFMGIMKGFGIVDHTGFPVVIVFENLHEGGRVTLCLRTQEDVDFMLFLTEISEKIIEKTPLRVNPLLFA